MSKAIKQHIIQLNQQSVQLQQQGQYEQALDIANKVCSLSIQYYGKENPNYGTSLYNVASIYCVMGKYNEAELLLRKAMVIYRRVFGVEHQSFADGLTNLGVLYDRMGKYADAELLFHKAMVILRNRLGEEHPDYAESLNNLAAIHCRMGRYAEAEPLYRRATEIWRNALGEKHPRFAISLNNLALTYFETGRYDQAEPLYRQSMEIRREVLGEEHPDFAVSLNNIGELYVYLGRYAEAELPLRQAMEIRRKVFGEEHADFAESLNNLAKLYYITDEHALAESLYLEATEIWRNRLGEKHPDFAGSLNHLALVYLRMGKYDRAEPLFRQAVEIQREVLGEEHPDFGASVNNLGELCSDVGRDAEAEILLRQSIEIKRRAFGEEHPDLATALIWLALSLTRLNRISEAYLLMQEAAAIDEKMINQICSISSENQRMNYIETLLGHYAMFVSTVYHFLENDQDAVQACFELVLKRKAIGLEVLAIQRDAILGGKFPRLQSKLRELSSLRMQIAQKTLAGPGPKGLEAHRRWVSEHNNKKELLEYELARQIPDMNIEQSVLEVDRKAIAIALPEDSALVEFICFDVFNFHAVPANEESQWEPPRYIAFLLPAGEPDNVQMIDLGEVERIDEKIARFREGVTGERGPDTDGNVRSIEDQGSVLRKMVFDPIVPAIGGRRRLLLSPDGDLTRLPFEILPLGDGRRLIDDYHISYVGVGRDIVRYEDKRTGNPADPLVIADPDFDLGDNITMSQEEVKGHFLRRFSNRRPERPLADQSPIPTNVEGCYSRLPRDIDLSKMHFDRLIGTRIEGENVARMLEVTPWLDVCALEGRLKAYRSPRILHIATHGYFLEDQRHDQLRRLGMGRIIRHLRRLDGQPLDNPLLRSGLALSGANTWVKGDTLPREAEDGLLTAEDVSGLDLFDTELVVLSACDTGLGEVHTGEGVFGLRRSFVLAGAKTLVMSLWKVPDKETQEMMQDFYKRLLQGLPRAEALREAQLAMKAKRPEPKYWGAFICQGEFSPLAKGEPTCQAI